MKKKFLPILVLMPLLLGSCSLFSNLTQNQPLSDAEMATRVAELLSTMTTPTSEVLVSPTPTLGEVAVTPTRTPIVIVINTATPTGSALGGVEETSAVTESAAATDETLTAETTPTATGTLEATATVEGDPINSLGAATNTDEMDSDAAWGWPVDPDSYTEAAYNDGYLLISNSNPQAAGWRLPKVAQLKNAYIELTVNSATCSEKDSYGIIFRVPFLLDPDRGYLYQVSCDGYYRLWKWDGNAGPDGKGKAFYLINWTQSDAIHEGANQVNRLGVKAVDNVITVYVNGVELGSVTDSSYPGGYFGVFVRADATPHYTVMFDQMRYWENP